MNPPEKTKVTTILPPLPGPGEISSVGEPEKKSSRRRRGYSNSTDRLPPSAIESEQGILGCCILDHRCIGDVVTKLTSETDFYDLRHQIIFKTLVSMWKDRKAIDQITLGQELKDAGELDRVGGQIYLLNLEHEVPSTSNLSHYIETVLEKAMLRELANVGTEVIGCVYENNGDINAILGDAERNILSIRAKREGGRGLADIADIQSHLMTEYEAALQGNMTSGLLTGFEDIDRVMGPMMPQDFIIIAGSPSAGKTTLLQNIIWRLANTGTHCGMFSLETSSKKLVHRWQCLGGHVDGSAFTEGRASEDDFMHMTAGVRAMSAAKKFIHLRDDVYDETGLQAACRQMYQAGCRMFGLDYLQLLKMFGDNEYAQVTAASKCVKRLAKELNVPFIAISSLNRGDKKSPEKKPTMADLRGSGNLEFDSDKIVLLHCEDRVAPIRTVEYNLAKNKDGNVGRRILTMFASQFRFETCAQPGQYVE